MSGITEIENSKKHQPNLALPCVNHVSAYLLFYYEIVSLVSYIYGSPTFDQTNPSYLRQEKTLLNTDIDKKMTRIFVFFRDNVKSVEPKLCSEAALRPFGVTFF